MYVCMYVGVYGYAFPRALTYGVETWHGVGDGPRGLRAYFRNDPTKGQRSSRGQVTVEMPSDHQTLNALLGSKVMQRSTGVK